MFAGNGNNIPGFIKYFIYSLMGIGPLWFCHVLFIGSLLIVLIRKIDKKEKINNLCKKIKKRDLQSSLFSILSCPLHGCVRNFYIESNQKC